MGSVAAGRVEIITGDCRDVLAGMDAASVHCVVTSPPYFGLRDYGMAAQIGLEPTPAEFVAALVEVFRAVRRVLRDDGTVWLNLGDSYAGGGRKTRDHDDKLPARESDTRPLDGLKPKDLIGIPWRVAFALQDDGWYLRQEVIWSKPNPMPESVSDRCTKAHEHVFLLTKQPRYWIDMRAIAEPVAPATVERLSQPTLERQAGSARVPGKTNGNMKAVGPRFGGAKYGDDDRDEARTKSGAEYTGSEGGMRNRRSVWTIATQPYDGAHFATMPPALAEPCILAGCPRGGTVLDPFGGAGTTGLVAARHGRRAVLIELNPAYADLARARIAAEWREQPAAKPADAAGPLFSEASHG